jgi:hypothetical protein
MSSPEHDHGGKEREKNSEKEKFFVPAAVRYEAANREE